MSLPTVHYNGSAPDGGDISMLLDFHVTNGVETFNINLWYTTGDVAWVLASTALVWLMIPGVGFFYSGLARRKSALSLIWLSLMSISVVSFQVSLR
jgi:ammonium transporter, Amt family